MNSPTREAAPYLAPRRVQPNTAGGWDGVVMWMLLSLMAIAWCAVTGVQQFGVFGTVAKVAPSPVVRALATAAHIDLSGQSYVDRVEWTKVSDGASLRVYPTVVGRQASTRLVGPDHAWAEVLRLAPDADKPGMREQFFCHWRFAEFANQARSAGTSNPGGRWSASSR